MEHEYLFRGKTIETNKWVHGGIFVQDGRYFIIKSITYSCGVTSWGAFEVDPKTIGRYVELNDKDNVKIFEDDIILFGDEPLIVCWNPEAFQWFAKKQNVKYPVRRFPDKDWEWINLGWIAAEADFCGKITAQVGGNIHDNEVVYEDEDISWEGMF